VRNKQVLVALAIFVLVIADCTSLAQSSALDPQKILKVRLDGYRQSSPLRPLVTQHGSTDALASGGAMDYVSSSGRRFSVDLVTAPNDSRAYSVFTYFLREMGRKENEEPVSSIDLGTASASLPNQLLLFKGQAVLRITGSGSRPASTEELAGLGRLLIEKLDNGKGEIPVLVKHLPDWQARQRSLFYAVDLRGLENEAGNQPVFESVEFEGGAEAVIAPYEKSQLVIIEFSTPQLAGDNDRRTTAKIRDLWNAGQSAPTAYRRVGNYLVFVFNGESERAANQLIDQVKYEQVVQWLGDNPYLLLEAQRQYTETTLGVFLAVVKASALALVACLGVGGLFGALLFTRRRAQQKAVETFSDAGGMLRLNLDEMTPQTDPARLLRGDSL